MRFASIFVPNFMLQAVVRAEPALRERAIALIDGNPPLCSVVATNEKAAQTGIELGMTKMNAAQFAGLEMRPRSQSQEKITHAVLLDIGWSVSPRIEDTAQDTIVLDLSGLTHLFGAEKDIGAHLAQRSCECGLLPNVAIASNVDTTLIAARGFQGITVIPPGQESKCLGDLPVGVLSPSVETAETLSRWGVRTCSAFADLPVLQLSERLGQEGVRLHALARGATSRSLAIAEPGHSFEEEMELDDPVEELDPLSFLLGRLLDQLCARLAARSLAAASLRVRFELQPSFENALDRRKEIFRRIDPPGVYEKELQLPVPARDSKMLLKLLRLRLQSNPPAAPIRKITIGAESARPRATQGGLFLPSFPDPEKLELTIARIANVVGEGNIGSPALVDTWRPGEFQMRRFLAPLEAAGAGHSYGGVAHPGRLHKSLKASTSFRIFRPPVPATLELHAGRPTRVFFQGLRGQVLAASGPWRTSGDWWREDPWQQDEWDLEIHFHPFSGHRDVVPALRPDCGLYRFYYDSLRASWFVRGIYD
jgi:protein ImuB